VTVPTDNVVPIDAEVARSIARRAIKFRWFVAGLTTVWLAALIPVVLFTPLPPLVPFVVLGALLVLAEHRFVLFGDETSMSGSIIVAIAAVFVFADTSPLAGPMLVASLGGLYLPHLRQRQFSLALSNAAGFGLSALGAASAVSILGGGMFAGWTATALVVLVAISIDWLANSVIVGVASGVRVGTPLRKSVREQLTSDTDVVALACSVGALSAINKEGSLTIAVLGIWIALAAFEIKLARRRQRATEAPSSSYRLLNAALVAITVLVVYAHPGLGTLAVAFLALFLVQATDQLMPVPATIGFVACAAGGQAALALGIPVPFVAPVLVTTAFAAIETSTLGARIRRTHSHFSRWTVVGLLVPSRSEFAALAVTAAVIALSTAIYPGGAGSSLVLGLALVGFAALAAKCNRPTALTLNSR